MIAKKDGCAKEKRGIKRPLAYGKAEKSPRYYRGKCRGGKRTRRAYRTMRLIRSQEHCCPQYKHSLKQKKEKESLKNVKRKNKNDN